MLPPTQCAPLCGLDPGGFGSASCHRFHGVVFEVNDLNAAGFYVGQGSEFSLKLRGAYLLGRASLGGLGFKSPDGYLPEIESHPFLLWREFRDVTKDGLKEEPVLLGCLVQLAW